MRRTDGIEALSVAEIAISREDLRRVVTDGNTAVLRLLADRRDELSQQRRQAVNRLHRHLRDLVPGGAPASLTAGDASKILGALRPADPVAVERSTSRGSSPPRSAGSTRSSTTTASA